jgi:His Kinase A (phospho-acceptor) domain
VLRTLLHFACCIKQQQLSRAHYLLLLLPLLLLLLLLLLYDSIVGIVQDITEICRMQQHEAEQKLATEQLNALLAAEIKHKEEMYRLLRTISHEIRNPLHGILGNAQALLELLREVEQQCTGETVNNVTAVPADSTTTAAVAAVATAATAAAAESTADTACMRNSDLSAVLSVPVLQRGDSTHADVDTTSNSRSSNSSSTVCSCSRSASAAATSGSSGVNGSTVDTSHSSSGTTDISGTTGLSAAAGVNGSSSSSSSNNNNSSNSSSSSNSRRRSVERQALRLRCSRSAPTLRLHTPIGELKHRASFNGTSSSSSCNGMSLLKEALPCSAKMAEAQSLVAEIHECALHQVSAIIVSISSNTVLGKS